MSDYNAFSVLGAIVFSAITLGESLASVPDYNKARLAAARVFELLDVVPSIDSSHKGGLQPVSALALTLNSHCDVM